MGGEERHSGRRPRGRLAAALCLALFAFAPGASAEFLRDFRPAPAPVAAPAQTPGPTGLVGGRQGPAYAVRTGKGLSLDGWHGVARQFSGIAVEVAPDGLLSGQHLRVFGGEGANTATEDYTAGMSWSRAIGASGRFGANLLYNGVRGDEGLSGQWVARMGGGLALPAVPGVPGLRFDGEFAAMPGDDATGIILRLAHPTSGVKGFSYSVEARRTGAGFRPLGFIHAPGREALEGRMDYHFSSGMRLGARSLLAAEGFGSANPLWVREAGLNLTTPTLPSFPDAGALSFHTFVREREDRRGVRHHLTRGFEFRLHQLLWLGWSTRIGAGFTWEENLVTDDEVLRRRFSVAGRHSLNLGPLNGVIGPGFAWRRSSGYEVCREFEAGLALELVGAMQGWALSMGVLNHENELDAAPSRNSWHTMLSYRLALGDANPLLGNGWYNLTLGLF